MQNQTIQTPSGPSVRRSARLCALATLVCIAGSWLPAACQGSEGVIAQSQVSRLGSHFSGEKSSQKLAPYFWLTVVPIVIAIGGSAFYQYHQKTHEMADAPSRLFRDLCREHHLTIAQGRTLRGMAKLIDARTPSVLLVRPDLFDRAAEKWSKEKGPQVAKELDDLRSLLFACQEQ